MKIKDVETNTTNNSTNTINKNGGKKVFMEKVFM